MTAEKLKSVPQTPQRADSASGCNTRAFVEDFTLGKISGKAAALTGRRGTGKQMIVIRTMAQGQEVIGIRIAASAVHLIKCIEKAGQGCASRQCGVHELGRKTGAQVAPHHFYPSQYPCGNVQCADGSNPRGQGERNFLPPVEPIATRL